MASTSNNIITLRRHDLDNLKTFLTTVVIAHHTALPYGGVGNAWAFASRLFPPGFCSPTLLLFNALNQSFFMGVFFWISGRMSAQSLQRGANGSAVHSFVRAKVIRLGIPSLVNTLVGPPLGDCIVQGRFRGVWQAWWAQLYGFRGVTWYTATLLMFDLVAALIHRYTAPTIRHEDQKTEKSGGALNLRALYDTMNKYGWILAATTCFILRLKYPVGDHSNFLGVQLAYLPQYVLAYVLGYLSLPNGNARMIGPLEGRSDEADVRNGNDGSSASDNRGSVKPSLPTALAVSAITLIACFCRLDDSNLWQGGINLVAAAYAGWNEAAFVLIGPALMEYFQRWHNKPALSRLWKPRYAYTAYLIHPTVSIAVVVVLDKILSGLSGVFENPLGLTVASVVLTGVVSYINSVLSFALARWLVDYFPRLRRIL